jgi:hypothetical protein
MAVGITRDGTPVTVTYVVWASYQDTASAREFAHSGLIAKYQLTTALARLRERGDREVVGEGFADFERRKQPLTLASPYPLPSERAVINCVPR